MPDISVCVDSYFYSAGSFNIQLQISNRVKPGCSISKILLKDGKNEIEGMTLDSDSYEKVMLRDIYLRENESITLKASFKTDNPSGRLVFMQIVTPVGVCNESLNVI